MPRTTEYWLTDGPDILVFRYSLHIVAFSMILDCSEANESIKSDSYECFGPL
jgi:hypothetical protein